MDFYKNVSPNLIRQLHNWTLENVAKKRQLAIRTNSEIVIPQQFNDWLLYFFECHDLVIDLQRWDTPKGNAYDYDINERIFHDGLFAVETDCQEHAIQTALSYLSGQLLMNAKKVTILQGGQSPQHFSSAA